MGYRTPVGDDGLCALELDSAYNERRDARGLELRRDVDRHGEFISIRQSSEAHKFGDGSIGVGRVERHGVVVS